MSETAMFGLGLFVFGLPTLLYLLRPVLTMGAVTVEDDRAAREARELLAERERSYTALTDLDFDFECGKISEGDYDRLRHELMVETAEVLARIDERIAATGADIPAASATSAMHEDALEREIARHKSGGRAGRRVSSADLEKEIEAFRSSRKGGS
jgi:hypothetical protein